MKVVNIKNLTHLAFCLLALFLVSVSIPQFLASLAWVPGATISRNLPDHPSQLELKEIIEAANMSLSFADNPSVRFSMATAMFKKLPHSQGNNEAFRIYLAATDEVRKSLEERPTNPFFLEFLANLTLAREDTGAELALTYLDASIVVAPYEPFLFDHRLRLGLNLYQSMNVKQRQNFTQQLVWAFDRDRSRFITMKMTIHELHLLIDLLQPWPEKAAWLAANRH